MRLRRENRLPPPDSPRFFDECLRLMRHRDPMEQEGGFQLLQPHAATHLERLLAAFESEADWGLRGWLLELIGDARDERALPVLARELANDDQWLRDWAVRGLEALDTPEARRLLAAAGKSPG